MIKLTRLLRRGSRVDGPLDIGSLWAVGRDRQPEAALLAVEKMTRGLGESKRGHPGSRSRPPQPGQVRTSIARGGWNTQTTGGETTKITMDTKRLKGRSAANRLSAAAH
jgi:hypothetical protein